MSCPFRTLSSSDVRNLLVQKGSPILLANSTGQNRCGKICLHRSANRDKNRALVLSVSTKIRSISRSFLLAVISPAVSALLVGQGCSRTNHISLLPNETDKDDCGMGSLLRYGHGAP